MKVFYQVLVNTFVTNIGNMTAWFGVTYFLYLQTRSVMATSILSGSYLVLTMLTGFWFGSLVDHHHKKPLMEVANLVSAGCYALAMGILALAPANSLASAGSYYLWAMIASILVGVIVGNIRNIVLPTMVTLLVSEEKRPQVNGVVGTVSGTGFLITSVISGFLVGQTGMWGVLGLSLVVATIATLHLQRLQIVEEKIVKTGAKRAKVDIAGTIKVIRAIPGLMPLILFATFNNFLGGVFMSLMDAYGLSMVSVQVWGTLWAVISVAFIAGGLLIAKWGLGKNPVRSLLLANLVIWMISAVFTLQASIGLLVVGCFIYLMIVPYIEASEQTIMQKMVPHHRQGRVFGFAQSVEQVASPITAFAIGPITQYIFIPWMTTGAGASLIGPWFGVGEARAIALVFTMAGLIGIMTTIGAMRSRHYRELSIAYRDK